jgi:hypothetical protein
MLNNAEADLSGDGGWVWIVHAQTPSNIIGRWILRLRDGLQIFLLELGVIDEGVYGLRKFPVNPRAYETLSPSTFYTEDWLNRPVSLITLGRMLVETVKTIASQLIEGFALGILEPTHSELIEWVQAVIAIHQAPHN